MRKIDKAAIPTFNKKRIVRLKTTVWRFLKIEGGKSLRRQKKPLLTVDCRLWDGFLFPDEHPLTGPPPYSGPIDVTTKNSFPLFFAGGKGLVHIYQNHFN